MPHTKQSDTTEKQTRPLELLPSASEAEQQALNDRSFEEWLAAINKVTDQLTERYPTVRLKS